MSRFRKLIIAMVFSLFLFALAACNGELTEREIEFQTTDEYLQWRYIDEEDWNNLIALDELEGPEGPQGPQGPAGDDGQDGTDGQDGQDGTDGQDGADGQDGQDGQDGADGADGVDGASAFDIYLDYYPGYDGDEAAWIKDLAQNKLVVELTVMFQDGYYETWDFMKGEALGEAPYDADWYLDDDLADLADASYILEDMMVYLAEAKYIHVPEVRLDDDGSDFNHTTGAYEPDEDHLPYGYLQFAANIVTTLEGDFEIEFKDVTEDVVFYEVSVSDMTEGDRWLQVAYKYADGTAIPVGNELVLTLTLSGSEGTFERVHEFEMTEAMHQNALFIQLAEERLQDDGTQFHPDGLPYGYMQYAGHILWTVTGDIEIIFEDITADKVIFNPSLTEAEAQDRWLEVKYVYTDEFGDHTDEIIPIGNTIRVTYIFEPTWSDGVHKIVREFEMTEEMYVNAVHQISVETTLASDDGDAIHTSGIVTQIIDSRTFFIEDESGAIAVYNDTGAIEAAGIEIGDHVVVNGLRATPWFGLKQIAGSPTLVILEKGLDLPAVIDMNAIDLTDDSAVEALFGFRIDLDNLLVVSEGSGSGSFNVTLMDPITEKTFVIRYNSTLDDADAAAYLAAFVEGDAVNLRGVTVSWFQGPQFAFTTETEVVTTTLPEATMNTYVENELALPETTMEDLALLTTFYVSGYDLTISWSSSNTDVITDAGVVTQPTSGEGHELVTMTATVTDGDAYTEIFTYDVLVYEEIGVVTWSYEENFDFVTSTSTSYSTSIQHTDTNGFEWDLLGRPGGADGFGLGNENDGSFIEVIAQGGIGHLEFDAVRMFTNTNTRMVEIFVNDVSYGTFTIDPESNTPQTFMVPYIDVEGEVTIRIESRSPGSRGAMDIQEVRWTTYTE